MDQYNTIYEGTHRIFLTKSNLKLRRVAVNATQIGKTTEDYYNGLDHSTGAFGDPELVNYLNKCDRLDLVSRAVSILDYQKERKENIYTDDKGQIKTHNRKSMPIAVFQKVSKMPADAGVTFYNDSLDTMTESEMENLLDYIDFNQYVQMICDFAKSWHNTRKMDLFAVIKTNRLEDDTLDSDLRNNNIQFILDEYAKEHIERVS